MHKLRHPEAALAPPPHVHALITDGMLEKGGGFLPLTQPDFDALEEFPDAVVAV